MDEIKPGYVLVEVNQGRDGSTNLTIGDNDTSERVAGPKGWGGSSVIHSFQVKASDLRRLADEYDPASAA